MMRSLMEFDEEVYVEEIIYDDDVHEYYDEEDVEVIYSTHNGRDDKPEDHVLEIKKAELEKIDCLLDYSEKACKDAVKREIVRMMMKT